MRLGDLDALKKTIDVIKQTGYDTENKPLFEYIELPDLIKIIDNTPTVEERPIGHWIVIGEEQGAINIIYKIKKCSNCGWEHSLVILDNFCPNCGADMRGINK